MDKTDILLPIFNSVDETRSCINSIIDYTPSDSYNLFLMDDNSTDIRIQELTDSYANSLDNVILIKNKKNLGFPGNVNNGFAMSKNDVIILNTDTKVTKGWLKNLKKVAYSEDNIAAVNPMSNYGSLSSIPTINNSINELVSYEKILTSFEKFRENRFVESPVLIGFCMYIKREALKLVGYFDAETFKRGYGEETDWCMRARNKGFKLVIATNTYVHHDGGTSFGNEKEELRNRSREILLNRYNNLDNEIQKFVEENHFKKIRKAMINDLRLLKVKTGIKMKLRIFKHYLKNI